MEEPNQAIRLQQNDKDQQQTIKQKMNPGEIDDQLFLHNTKHRSAQYRTPDGADTSNYGHQQNGNTGTKGKDAARLNENGIARVDAAGDAG